MTHKLMIPTEARQLLRISKSTRYRLVRSGKLPSIHGGGAYRIRMSGNEDYQPTVYHIFVAVG